VSKILTRVRRIEGAMGVDRERPYIFVHFNGAFDKGSPVYKKGDFIGNVVIAQRPLEARHLSDKEALLENGYEIVSAENE